MSEVWVVIGRMPEAVIIGIFTSQVAADSAVEAYKLHCAADGDPFADTYEFEVERERIYGDVGEFRRDYLDEEDAP